jgi:hypothetical protein
MNVNEVIYPDGTTAPVGQLIAEAAATFGETAPIVGELRKHAEQGVWGFEAMGQRGGPYAGVTYKFLGGSPTTGTIVVTGGQGTPSGGVTPITGTITPTGWHPDEGSAPLPAPSGATAGGGGEPEPTPMPAPSIVAPIAHPSSSLVAAATSPSSVAPAPYPSVMDVTPESPVVTPAAGGGGVTFFGPPPITEMAPSDLGPAVPAEATPLGTAGMSGTTALLLAAGLLGAAWYAGRKR